MAYPLQGTINKTVDSMEDLYKIISEQGFDAIGPAFRILMNEAMKAERSRYLGTNPYERSTERHDYANGFKSKTVKTRVGALELNVPQVRSSDFYPQSLERGLRSEQALSMAVAQMYLIGVSTRKVKAITQQLCGLDISSSEVSRITKKLDEEFQKWRDRRIGKCKYLIVDAIYEKVRRDGCVVGSAVLIAHGIDEEGRRDVLGLSVSLSEHEVHWRAFFESLIARGLHGLEMIVSDAHTGLKAAKQVVFPTVPWQRCQFHLQQNASSYVSKKPRKLEVAGDIRAIFNAPNETEARRLLDLTVEKYKDCEKKLAAWMETSLPEGFTVFSRPKLHQVKLRTSNLAERVNKEIRRRTKVVGIFPHEESCLRLITAVLCEISEDWMQGKRYLAKED